MTSYRLKTLLEAGLALVKKLFPQIYQISQHELHSLWKKGGKKYQTLPKKEKDPRLEIVSEFQTLIFWEEAEKIGKHFFVFSLPRNLHLSSSVGAKSFLTKMWTG